MADRSSIALKQNDPARSLVKLALSGQQHPDPEVRVAAEKLLNWWRSGAADRLDRAVGIAPGPGQRSATTRAALAERDKILRRIRSEYHSGVGHYVAAGEISKALKRYRCTGWRRERSKSRPASEDTLRGLLWRLLKLHDRELSPDTIARIVKAGSD